MGNRITKPKKILADRENSTRVENKEHKSEWLSTDPFRLNKYCQWLTRATIIRIITTLVYPPYRMTELNNHK
ncbi:unnamed protein product [Allacma fusca]|uniref:Uncharacterized protein n=1 Tax=Allacma fusca TaxID=39272 RepID=A0A8J2KMM7_9HEXA|nr:unnamed protein product [Allacma fusca]